MRRKTRLGGRNRIELHHDIGHKHGLSTSNTTWLVLANFGNHEIRKPCQTNSVSQICSMSMAAQRSKRYRKRVKPTVKSVQAIMDDRVNIHVRARKYQQKVARRKMITTAATTRRAHTRTKMATGTIDATNQRRRISASKKMMS